MWTIRRSVGSETRIRPWAVAWLSVTSRNRSGHEVSLQAVERLELPDHLLFFLQRSGQQVTLVPELFGVPFDLFDQPGHPRQDQKEDGPGPEGESCRVRRFAQKGLHGEDTRDHQRRSGKKDQPPPVRRHERGGGRLGQCTHGRMKSGRAYRHVREQPTDVDQIASVVRAGELQAGEGHVGAESQEQAGAQQPVGDRSFSRREGEAGQETDQQEVHDRVRHGDEEGRQRQCLVGVSIDPEDPGNDGQAGRDDQGVDEAGSIPFGVPVADHESQSGREERIACQTARRRPKGTACCAGHRRRCPTARLRRRSRPGQPP